MNQGLEHQMPSFNLPCKILCKVVNIHLRVSYNNLNNLRYFFKSVTYLEVCCALL